MTDNKEQKREKTPITAVVSQETIEYIKLRAAQERRKPSAMAAIILEDAAADAFKADLGEL